MLSKVTYEEDRLANNIRTRNDLHQAVMQATKDFQNVVDEESAIRESVKYLVAEEVIDGKDNHRELEVEQKDEEALLKKIKEARERAEELDAAELRMNGKIQAGRADLKRDRAMENVEEDVLSNNILAF